ncbi:MAG: hypothetical protein IJ411_02365, partial [Oscillospiraceae bacterium]|nr:hypothetical protein [Oscillospiraceae bacterium]
MEQIFLNILEVSLGGALVIALMLLVAPLAGKKFSAKWRYWIWLVLAIRLLLPLDFNLPNPLLTIEVPQQLTVEQNVVPKAEPENGFLREGTSTPAISTESTDGDIVVETEPISPIVGVETREAWRPTVLELLALVWLTGAVVSLIWQGVSYARWQRDCRLWNRPVEDGDVLNDYYDLCRELGIGKFPRLMRNRRVQSPMMIGLLDPMILLPDMEYSEEDYAVVLTHELNHYKRRDLWYKLLLLLTRCVHWFNPLVWLMLREADNDLEITCDEAVVKNHSGDDRAIYCEAILRIMCRGKGKYALLSTGFNGGKKVLQRRFSAVLNEKASRGFALGAMAMVLVLLCGGLVACELTEEGKEANITLSAEQTEDEHLKEELLASLVQENYPQASEAALQNLKDYLADKDLQSIIDTLADQQYLNYLLRDEYWGIESQETTAEEQPTEQESQNTESVPSVSAVASSVASGSGSNRYEPFAQSFRGLDVHATEQYETLSYYTTDSSAIAAIMEELDWENKQPAAAKKELYTHDVTLSGQFIRLITDNMEQLYVYQDHDQALYRDKTGNRTYYDVDERTYDDLFGVIDEVNQWKKNPVTDSRSEPFDENYTTLDLYVSDQPDNLPYTLTIRTFCEMLIDDLNWEEVAEKDLSVSDYLSPVDLSDGHYVRISTNTGRHLYIYKDHP